MLCKISLLRIGFSAVLANVRLKVFGLLVLGNVFEEGGFVRKTLITGVTLVRLVGLVAPRVALQVAQLRERFIAAGVPAFVWLVARMGTNMLL